MSLEAIKIVAPEICFYCVILIKILPILVFSTYIDLVYGNRSLKISKPKIEDTGCLYENHLDEVESGF